MDNKKIILALELAKDNPDMDITKLAELIGVSGEKEMSMIPVVEEKNKTLYSKEEEIKILNMRNKGSTAKEIADELGRSELAITSKIKELSRKGIVNKSVRIRHDYKKHEDELILHELEQAEFEPSRVPMETRKTLANLIGVSYSAIYTRMHYFKKKYSRATNTTK